MSRWLISVPVWGGPYVRTFELLAAPALRTAVVRLREPVKFLVHTDAPGRVRAALQGFDVEVKPVTDKPTYSMLQEGHNEAVRSASVGDRVVLLNADLVVSGNLLLRCAQHFAAGKQAVVLLGIRTVECGEAPCGAAPRELLAWAWEHRHQIIRDLEWPGGGSMLPTNIFWEVDGDVVARGFHLHPVAIVKGTATTFKSTIDGDLLDCFERPRVHVVCSPDDCAMLEVSPRDRRFPVRSRGMSAATIAAAMHSRASTTHKWLLTHRIVVCGTGLRVKGDDIVAREVLESLRGSSFGRPPAPYRGGRSR